MLIYIYSVYIFSFCFCYTRISILSNKFHLWKVIYHISSFPSSGDFTGLWNTYGIKNVFSAHCCLFDGMSPHWRNYGFILLL